MCERESHTKIHKHEMNSKGGLMQRAELVKEWEEK